MDISATTTTRDEADAQEGNESAMKRAFAGLLLVSPLLTARSQTPTLRVDGDGHACYGIFRKTSKRLLWKSSFSVCDSAYRVTSQTSDDFTLELIGPPGFSSHACSFKVVSLHQLEPLTQYRLWEVAGYLSPSDLSASPPRPALACNMQAHSPGLR